MRQGRGLGIGLLDVKLRYRRTLLGPFWVTLSFGASAAALTLVYATLFKLIKGEMPQQTMLATFGNVLKDDDIWKILAFVRSLYKGDPSKINW